MKRFLVVAAIIVATLGLAGCNRSDVPTTQAASTPASAPAAAPAPPPVVVPDIVLPAGTTLAVRTSNTLSTKAQQAGETFTANLAQPLIYEGRELAPRGAEVEGKIVDSDEGGRVKGVASLTVRLTAIRIDGHSVDISTNTVTREAHATKHKDAEKIAIGSGIGAVIGAIAGGGQGAAIGAAAGGGAGTGVVLATHGDPAVISSESLLQFRLRAPLTLPQK